MHDENACAPSLGRPALGWWRGACVYCNDIELTGRTCEVAIAVHGKHGFVVTKFHPLTLTVKFCAGPHFSWNCAMDFFWPRSPCSPGATMSADFLKVFQQQTAKCGWHCATAGTTSRSRGSRKHEMSGSYFRSQDSLESMARKPVPPQPAELAHGDVFIDFSSPLGRSSTELLQGLFTISRCPPE